MNAQTEKRRRLARMNTASDAAAAKMLGLNYQTYNSWRVRAGLKPKRGQGRPRKRVSA